jgi:hypothetical protein
MRLVDIERASKAQRNETSGAGMENKRKEGRVTYTGGRFGPVVQLTGCGRLFLRWCWGRAGGTLSSCTALAPDHGTSMRLSFGHGQKRSKILYGSNFIQRRTRKRVSETYRAEFYAPPQLDAVEIEVAIGPQREVDLVIDDRL